MEKCKYCEAELEENSTVCPNCGKDNAEPETVVAPVPEAVEEAAAEVVQAEEAPAEAQAEAPAAEEAVEPALDMKEGESTQKVSAGKVALYTALIIVIAAVLIALVVSSIKKQGPTGDNVDIDTTPAQTVTEPVETTEATIPADGNPDDVTCKGTYTDTDDAVVAASDTVIANVGDYTLTNGELQIFYWLGVQQFLSSYGSYLDYVGLDLSRDMATQPCSMAEGLTWQQYFLHSALNNWCRYQALAAESEINNVPVEEEFQAWLETLPDEVEAVAKQYNFADAEDFLKRNYGAAATMDNFKAYYTVCEHGSEYYLKTQDSFEVDDAAVEAYFAEHAAQYEEGGLTKDTSVVDVRHILVFPEGATNETIRTETFADEAWAAGEKKAQEILSTWQAGEKTEESFAALANEKSEDAGSNTNGGLYTGVSEGQMVQAFNDWIFDTERQVGDTDIVKTEFGYHVMYFSGKTPVWQDYAKSDLIQELSDQFLEDVMSRYEMKVDYSAIKLANVELGAA